MKQVIIAVLAVVAIIGGAVVLGKDNETASGETSNHIFGNVEASVKLVEYGDFECPACQQFYPIVKQVKEQYKDRLSFQFKHFPLVQTHQNALAAHRAAEAAGKQGKFYEMHDALYERMEDWNGPSGRDPVGIQTAQAISLFETYANELNLDMEKFRADVAAESTVSTINADTEEGKSKGVTGTPTFFLNDKKIDDLTSISTVEQLSALIDEALGEDTAPTNETSPNNEPAKPEEETTNE
jgi:protein-disulfide isomerase